MKFRLKAYNVDTNLEFTLELPDNCKTDGYYLDTKVLFNNEFITFNKVCDKLVEFDRIHIKDSDNFFIDCIDDDAIYDKYDIVCDISSELEDLAHNTQLLNEAFAKFKRVYADVHTIQLSEDEFSDKANVLWKLYYAIYEIELPNGY